MTDLCQYKCPDCFGYDFTLFDNGMAICSGCSTILGNIAVIETEDDEGANDT